MASGKGFKNLAINYGRDVKGVTAPKYLKTKATDKAAGSVGLSMGGHTRLSSHALTTATGKNPSGSHKAAK